MMQGWIPNGSRENDGGINTDQETAEVIGGFKVAIENLNVSVRDMKQEFKEEMEKLREDFKKQSDLQARIYHKFTKKVVALEKDVEYLKKERERDDEERYRIRIRDMSRPVQITITLGGAGGIVGFILLLLTGGVHP